MKIKTTKLTRTIFLITTLLVWSYPNAMVTSNILQKTFQIRTDSANFGTGFTIEVDQKQYLVTARHVVDPNAKSIEVMHNGKWKELRAKIIPVEPDSVDIIVIALEQQLSPPHPMLLGIAGSYLSQEVFFAGFPYGLMMDGNTVNAHFPLPLVKKGIIAALSGAKLGEPTYLDAINNPGFSGGPVFTTQDPAKPRVIGVISGYRIDFQPVFNNKKPIQNVYVQNNSGLTVIYSIDYALRAIEKAPIGFDVSP